MLLLLDFLIHPFPEVGIIVLYKFLVHDCSFIPLHISEGIMAKSSAKFHSCEGGRGLLF